MRIRRKIKEKTNKDGDAKEIKKVTRKKRGPFFSFLLYLCFSLAIFFSINIFLHFLV